jgi:RNA polymerase sigma-70 factor, ECF subfamily
VLAVPARVVERIGVVSLLTIAEKTRQLGSYSPAVCIFAATLRSGAAAFDDKERMISAGEQEVRSRLPQLLPRLWRYALLLAGVRDVAEDLVQATCARAIERAYQYNADTRLDRWLFSILRSIWLNELRSRRIREGRGFVDPEEALFSDGAEIETNIFAGQVLNAVHGLPEAQRETVLLVYVEGLSYAEAAEFLGAPIGTIMSRLAAARLKLAALRTSEEPPRKPTVLGGRS